MPVAGSVAVPASVTVAVAGSVIGSVTVTGSLSVPVALAWAEPGSASPGRYRSAGSSRWVTRMKASTRAGSNWEPAQRRSSAAASPGERGVR